MKNVAAVILAAGKGTRMKSQIPKVLHEVCGWPLVRHVVSQVKKMGIKKIIVVVGYRKNLVIDCLRDDKKIKFIEQRQQQGTGHALLMCEKELQNFRGDILVLPGDVFIESIDVIKKFCSYQKKHSHDMSLLTATLAAPKGYGRIIRDAQENVVAIREELDASRTEKGICEVNTSIYFFKKNMLFPTLRRLKKNRIKKEYYLTDIVSLYSNRGLAIGGYNIDDLGCVVGVNNRVHLAVIQDILKKLIIKRHQLNGVTVMDPNNTYIEMNVKIGNDTVIYPFTYIEKDVNIGMGCKIGPFCKIRCGSSVRDNSNIGSFVEIVRSRVGSKTNIKHLSYIGDTKVGDKVNIGAGTITANFDGRKKHQTKINDNAFIGSNTVLVAPVNIGRGAKTGAGAVVPKRRNIPKGKIAVGVPARVM